MSNHNTTYSNRNDDALSGIVVFWAAEQIDSAPVVTLSMHGAGPSNLH